MAEGGKVYFCNHFIPDKTGGAETVTRDWTSGLQNRGKNVVWYCPEGKSDSNAVPLPNDTEIRPFQTFRFRGGRRLVQPESLTKFRRDLITEKPEKVIFSLPADERLIAFMWTAILAGRPDAIVAVFHGDPMPPDTKDNTPDKSSVKTAVRPAYRLVKKSLLKTALSHPDATAVAVSQATAHRVHELGLVDKLPAVCPPSSPHNNPDCHPQPRSSVQLPLAISTVCRVSPEKGLLNRFAPLAKAAASRDLPVKFSVVGPIDQPKLAQAVIETSAGTVSFEGPRYGPDLCNTYNQLSLFSLLSDTEGSGLVLAEAARHAAPIIGTDIPAIREFMSNSGQSVGVLLNPNDQQELVDQGLEFITHVLRHPEALSPLSSAALALSRQYDPGVLSGHFLNTIFNPKG